MHNIFRLILLLLHDLCKFRTAEKFVKTQTRKDNHDGITEIQIYCQVNDRSICRYQKTELIPKKWFTFEGIPINTTSVKVSIKETELPVTANLHIGRKCIFNLQFTTGGTSIVQAFYRKVVPRFSLDLHISEEERDSMFWFCPVFLFG